MFELEDALYELEEATATLGFLWTAFAEGDSIVDSDELAAVVCMLYKKQRSILEQLKTVLENNLNKAKN